MGLLKSTRFIFIWLVLFATADDDGRVQGGGFGVQCEEDAGEPGARRTRERPEASGR